MMSVRGLRDFFFIFVGYYRSIKTIFTLFLSEKRRSRNIQADWIFQSFRCKPAYVYKSSSLLEKCLDIFESAMVMILLLLDLNLGKKIDPKSLFHQNY